MRWSVSGALIGVGLLVLLSLPPQWSQPLRNAWAEFSPERTQIGQIRALRLKDGSMVILDTDSALAVNVTPTLRRLVLLKGRARFDVHHDPQHPFTVSAGDGVIVARGTLFDVALNGGNEVAVTLVRGAVDIERHERAKTVARVAQMHPGQTAAFGSRLNHLAINSAVTAEDSWPDGVLTFDKAPLREVLAAVNRYAVRKIDCSDPATGELAVTGVFHVGDANHLAQTLAATLSLQLQDGRDGGLVLHRST